MDNYLRILEQGLRLRYQFLMTKGSIKRPIRARNTLNRLVILKPSNVEGFVLFLPSSYPTF